MPCTLKIVKMATYKYFITIKKGIWKIWRYASRLIFLFLFFFLFWELKHWQISEFAMGWKEILLWSLFFTEVKNFNFSILLRVCNKSVIWRESFSGGMACYYNIRNLGGWEVVFQAEVIKTLPGTEASEDSADSPWLTVTDRFTGSGGENPALREPQQRPSKSSRRKWRYTEPFIYKAVSHTQRLGMDRRAGWTWGREGPGLRGQPGMGLGRWGLPWWPSGLRFQPGGAQLQCLVRELRSRVPSNVAPKNK